MRQISEIVAEVGRRRERVGRVLTRPAGAGAVVRWFRIKSVQADHYVCREWDWVEEEEGAEDVMVARPHRQRRTPWDGQTVGGVEYTYSGNSVRVADDGDITEDQEIVPGFIVDDSALNDMILAAHVPGGTGVIVSGSPVMWCDLNLDGRAWARV